MTDRDEYRVTLTAEERADLEQLVSCGKAAARKLTHARILLLADDSFGDERSDEQLVAALGTSPRTVSRVRQRLVTQGLDVAFLRRRQPPRPDQIKIKGDVEQRRIQPACSDPPRAAATGPYNGSPVVNVGIPDDRERAVASHGEVEPAWDVRTRPPPTWGDTTFASASGWAYSGFGRNRVCP